jgi:hypothetical protein
VKDVRICAHDAHRRLPGFDRTAIFRILMKVQVWGVAMRTFSEPVSDDARKFALNIVEMPEPELSDLIHSLRWHRRLTSTVHALNGMVHNPQDAELGTRALRRLGLERCG